MKNTVFLVKSAKYFPGRGDASPQKILYSAQYENQASLP